MGKTKDTSRELANVELDTVTGGLVVAAINRSPWIGRPPANAAAMASWNDLLRQNGF